MAGAVVLTEWRHLCGRERVITMTKLIVGMVCGLLAAKTAFTGNDADIFVGTVDPGHATPAATAPFGMIQAGPDTSSSPDRFIPGKTHTSGYDFRDGWLWRFSQTHVEGTGCCAFGDFGILPCSGDFDGVGRPAKMLKATERARPGSYALSLDEKGARISVEIAALPRSAAYRIRYPKGMRAKLLLDLDWGLADPNPDSCFGKRVLWSKCEFVTPQEIRGGRRARIWNDYENYFSLATSLPLKGSRCVRVADGLRGEIWELDFGEIGDGVLEIRLGLSFSSAAAAVRNRAEEAGRLGFDEIRDRASAGWADLLGRIRLDPATAAETAASFKAALYRLCSQPNDLSDIGSEPNCSTFSLWDTFRAAHPLYTILVPERVAGFVNSMLNQYDRQGYLPIWSLGLNENHCMIGHHAVPVIVDAYLKGVSGVDWERAYRAVKDSLTVNHKAVGDGTWGLVKEDWDILDRYGYYPFDLMRGDYKSRKVRGESVSRVLECAYDDACAARLARGLGHAADAEFFEKRSANWKNVFDPSVGFMRGKDSKGNWREPFSPWDVGAGPWRENDFCEGNSWQYTWHVMQDPDGLIAALGGCEKFVAKLESLFGARPLSDADGASYDVSGMIGQYAHGNEPSHHVIYFFTLAGRNDLAAKYIRKVFDTQYAPRPDGLCGNDDCGQMSAWYLFSAMGFYPFDPCGGEYVLGAPQVPGVTLNLANGKTFTMTAKNLSKENKYVKSVTLNGSPIADWKIRHADIMNGGELVFEMIAK